jgi:hypothetical protein
VEGGVRLDVVTCISIARQRLRKRVKTNTQNNISSVPGGSMLCSLVTHGKHLSARQAWLQWDIRCWAMDVFSVGSVARLYSGSLFVLGGGVEYLHCSPARRTRRRKGKSGIWGGKIWPRVPRDSGPKMTALARARSNYKQQTRPLVRESTLYQQTRNCLKITTIWSWAPEGCFIPRKTGRLTVGRNIRLRLRLRLSID